MCGPGKAEWCSSLSFSTSRTRSLSILPPTAPSADRAFLSLVPSSIHPAAKTRRPRRSFRIRADQDALVRQVVEGQHHFPVPFKGGRGRGRAFPRAEGGFQGGAQGAQGAGDCVCVSVMRGDGRGAVPMRGESSGFAPRAPSSRPRPTHTPLPHFSVRPHTCQLVAVPRPRAVEDQPPLHVRDQDGPARRRRRDPQHSPPSPPARPPVLIQTAARGSARG